MKTQPTAARLNSANGKGTNSLKEPMSLHDVTFKLPHDRPHSAPHSFNALCLNQRVATQSLQHPYTVVPLHTLYLTQEKRENFLNFKTEGPVCIISSPSPIVISQHPLMSCFLFFLLNLVSFGSKPRSSAPKQAHDGVSAM